MSNIYLLPDFPSVVTEYYTYLEGREPYSSLKNLANCLGDKVKGVSRDATHPLIVFIAYEF